MTSIEKVNDKNLKLSNLGKDFEIAQCIFSLPNKCLSLIVRELWK